MPFVNGDATLRYVVEGRPLDGLYHGMGGWRPISSHYFETMRDSARERPGVHRSRFARRRQALSSSIKPWPTSGGRSGDAIGQRVTLGKGLGGVWDEPSREIVGIVANVRDSALDREAQPANYVPIAQLRMPLQLGWLVRTHVDPETLRPRIEQELQRASGGMPVTVTTVGQMDALIQQSTAQTAFRMWLMGAFAVVALVLATIGVYG